MECETCKKSIDISDVPITTDPWDGVNVEVTFECPHCGQQYSYSFDADMFDTKE
jgi:hypothetical protein